MTTEVQNQAKEALSKLIVALVTKKGGLKLIDLAKLVSEETKAKVTSKDLKPMVTDLFTSKQIDLVEFKTPSNDENKMFLVPIGTSVVHGDSKEEDAAEIVEVNTDVLLPDDMITLYAVLTDTGIESFTDKDIATGAFLAAKGSASAEEAPKVALYGLIPIRLEYRTFLDLPKTSGDDPELDIIDDADGGDLDDDSLPDLTADDGDDTGTADDNPFKTA